MLLRRPKAKREKVLVLMPIVPTDNNSSVNSTASVDEVEAYCEKLLKLADIALQGDPARQPNRNPS